MSTRSKRKPLQGKKKKPMEKKKRRTGPHKFEMLQLSYGKPPTPEIKSVDVQVVAIPSDNPHIVLLNAVNAGSTFYQRTGRKIAMKSLEFRGSFVPTNDVAIGLPGFDFVRMLIIYDRQSNNQGPPAMSDFLMDRTSTGSIIIEPFSGLNLTNSERFVILKDFMWGMPQPINLAPLGMLDYTQKTTIHFFIDLKGLETHWSEDISTGASDISTGCLWCVPYGLNPLGNVPNFIRATTRLRYWDC